MNTKQMLWIVLAALLTAVAYGAVTLTEREEWTLTKSGTSQGVIVGTLDDCKARARELAKADTLTNGTVPYVCQTERHRIIAAYSANPPPTCPPLPPPETRSQPCPSGTTGTWTQTRTSTAAPHPTCAIVGEWLPTSPPAGACTTTPLPTGDTIRHGQPFTVTGSSFGTKPNAAPLAFDDFEAGAAGTTVPGKNGVVGRWLSNDYCTGITYEVFEGKKVARHAFGPGGRYNASLCIDPAPTTTVYIDFWAKGVRLDANKPSRNWKVWRFYSAGDSEVGNAVYWCVGGGVDLGGGWTWLTETPPPQNWIHYEVIQRPGGSRHYRDGKLDMSSSDSSPPSVGQIRIGHYWGLDGVSECPGGNPGANVYTDDVYVDNSVARVVLASASTFDGSTKRQVQRATAWAAGSVTVVGNTRGFAVGEAAYVLVMDASNVQRKAHQVTVQ